MDNSSGHESDIALPGLRIELLPKRCTSKYQTLDIGLIDHANIRYCSTLLHRVFGSTLRWSSGENNFPLSEDSGRFGIRDGHLPQ